jgi:hypothetical protein
MSATLAKCSVETVDVGYRNEDDGIWLTCEVCQWEKNVGFAPSVTKVFKEAEHHAMMRKKELPSEKRPRRTWIRRD